MPRVGVDYETIKHTAIQLLSQGHAPSVQKVRELLGTGSNTTIAGYLKQWREEHASKTIHHLPATLPKELIATIEVLWQTAMEHAAQQLAAIKHSLDEQAEKFRLDKVAYEKADHELRARLENALQSLDNKSNHIQTLQTDVALLQEKLTQHLEETNQFKAQQEKMLQRAYSEKNSEVEKTEKLQSDITELHQQLAEQAKQHQRLLNDERALQENSEKRWIKLIDQARTETNEQRKHFENIVSKKDAQVEKLQSALSALQQTQFAQQCALEQKNQQILTFSEQYQLFCRNG